MIKILNNCFRWIADYGPGFTLLITLAVPGISTAALLDNTIELPLIGYNNQGTTTDDAGTDVFLVDASPLALLIPGSPPVNIEPIPGGTDNFIISITVDETGTLTGGTPGDDLVIIGEVTVPGMDTTWYEMILK